MNLLHLKKSLPITPGVYFMKNAEGGILYVGKAGNLKRRVMSYFERPQELRIGRMVSEVARVDFEKTDTVIEALILEARMIKQYQPRYNVLEKDDKSFLYVVIPRESFPRVLAMREKESLAYDRPLGKFGPFTSGSAVREALRILRRIFPFNVHDLNHNPLTKHHLKHSPKSSAPVLFAMANKTGRAAINEKTNAKPCFNYHIGLCPGTCAGLITASDYRKIIRQVILFFQGKKKRILSELKKEMTGFAKAERYEEAAVIRRRIAHLTHIHDVALIARDEIRGDESSRSGGVTPGRIEGYDISNISGTSSVGSMVVFTDGIPDKSQYRKFKIKTVKGPNDVGMLAEVLLRRFSHHDKTSVQKIISSPVLFAMANKTGERISPTMRGSKVLSADKSWPTPDIVLVDGGLPQVNAARGVLSELKISIPVVGIAKGKERKRNDFFYPPELHDIVRRNRDILIKVRDEAHRFAIKYHRELRSKLR